MNALVISEEARLQVSEQGAVKEVTASGKVRQLKVKFLTMSYTQILMVLRNC